jgi:hypothetical protein
LQEIVLIDHAARKIEVSRRSAGGFLLLEHRGAEPMQLVAIDATLRRDAVYAGV